MRRFIRQRRKTRRHCRVYQGEDIGRPWRSSRILDSPYTNFFARRAGYPAPKKKHAARQAFAYPRRVKVCGQQVFLPKIGWVAAVMHREISGTIKTVAVSREPTGKYYAAILTDDGRLPVEPLRHLERVTGIALGIKDAVTTSEGGTISNPPFLRRALKHIKRKQQAAVAQKGARQTALRAGRETHSQSSG
jgi:putative transposase